MQPKSVNQPGTSTAPRSGSHSLLNGVGHLSVQDFLAMANWQGEPVAPATAAIQPSDSDNTAEGLLTEILGIVEAQMGTAEPPLNPVSEETWLCLTVEQFFARQNWQGLAHPAPVSPKAAATTVLPPAPALTLNLENTVHAFFQRLPWEGTPAIGSLPKIDPIQEVSELEMTLSDLSDLF
jgi:hypothetical protein